LNSNARPVCPVADLGTVGDRYLGGAAWPQLHAVARAVSRPTFCGVLRPQNDEAANWGGRLAAAPRETARKILP